MVPHPETPIFDCFYNLLRFYVLTVSESSCLAKSYSVSGLTPLPHIPNLLHFIQKSAYERLMRIWRLESGQLSIKIICFIHL